MAETQSTPKQPETPQAKTEQAPAQAGRQQAGEKVEGAVSTRVPRGVGEPASDAVAEHEGVALTQESVRKQVNADNEKGYRGTQVTTVPNENYTVAGVTAGLPTPETTVYTPRGQ